MHHIRRKYIVVRSCGEEHRSDERLLDYSKKVKEVFSFFFSKKEHFKEYLLKHGMHFSEKLASYVSSHMVNSCEIVNGVIPKSPKHSWSAEEVEKALSKLGLSFSSEHKHDYHYAANMAYADFYGSSLSSESDCIKYAHDYINDPDGYPELAFSRWLADVLVTGEDIDWEQMI